MYLRTIVSVEEDVEGLEISMPGLVAVEKRQALRYISDDVPGQLHRNTRAEQNPATDSQVRKTKKEGRKTGHSFNELYDNFSNKKRQHFLSSEGGQHKRQGNTHKKLKINRCEKHYVSNLSEPCQK